ISRQRDEETRLRLAADVHGLLRAQRVRKDTPMTLDQIQRWRLILGKSTGEELNNLARCQGCLGGSGLLAGEAVAMDDALDLVYPGEAADGMDITKDEWARDPGSKHSPVKGRSFPRVARWLGEVRRLFPKDVVVLIQKDAIERRGLKQL